MSSTQHTPGHGQGMEGTQGTEGTNSLPHPSSPGGTQAGHVPISPKDTNSGQGAKEILGAASGGAKERALRKANAFLGAWSRNFSKPAIIVPSLGESEQLPRRRDGSPVQPSTAQYSLWAPQRAPSTRCPQCPGDLDVSCATLPLQSTRLSRKPVGLGGLD